MRIGLNLGERRIAHETIEGDWVGLGRQNP